MQCLRRSLENQERGRGKKTERGKGRRRKGEQMKGVKDRRMERREEGEGKDKVRLKLEDDHEMRERSGSQWKA